MLSHLYFLCVALVFPDANSHLSPQTIATCVFLNNSEAKPWLNLLKLRSKQEKVWFWIIGYKDIEYKVQRSAS